MNQNELLRQLAQRQPRAVVATRTDVQEQSGSWQEAAIAATLVTAALAWLARLG